jgi:hypothetical protein
LFLPAKKLPFGARVGGQMREVVAIATKQGSEAVRQRAAARNLAPRLCVMDCIGRIVGVWILDRQGVENAACECYAVVKREMDKVAAKEVKFPR